MCRSDLPGCKALPSVRLLRVRGLLPVSYTHLDVYKRQVTPRSKVKLVAKMLKAIHAQESKKAAREKAKAVVYELRSMKLREAAKKVEDGIDETLTYCDFPSEHWTCIRTNNVIERLTREMCIRDSH